MKTVLVSIRNELLATAVIRVLKECGDFFPFQVSPEVSSDNSNWFKETEADILLMEISYLPSVTMEVRLNEIKQIRKDKPGCKIVVFCDDVASPRLAYKVTQLKKDRLIDGFLYTSVTASYLMSTLVSL